MGVISSLRTLASAPRLLADAQTRIAALESSLSRARRYASGVPMVLGKYDIEEATAFKGTKKWETVEKMMVDPRVVEAVRATTLPLLQADWTLEPASDKAKDVEIAEFVGANLYHLPSDKYGIDYWTETPWVGQRLPEVLDMLEAGFSMFHRMWGVVNGKRVVKRLTWLEPSSVDPQGWKLDDQDNLVAVERTYRTPTGAYHVQEPIPGDQIQLYAWGFKGARYEGKAFIRALYGPWMRRDRLLRWTMLHAQRSFAPPVLAHYNNATESERAEFEEFIKRVAEMPQEGDYFLGSIGMDGQKNAIELPGSDVEIDRMRTILDAESADIAHGGGTKNLLGGETQYGSRSTSESQGSVEMLMVQAVASVVASQELYGVGAQNGLIQSLVDENFEGAGGYPKLVVSRISPTENADKLTQLAALKAAGLLPDMPEVHKQVVSLAGFNIPDEAIEKAWQEAQAAKKAMQSALQDGSPNPPPNTRSEQDEDAGANDEPVEAAALSAVEGVRAHIESLLRPMEDAPKGGGFRGRTVLEARYVALEAVQGSFRTGEDDMLAELRRARWAMTEEIMRRRRKGVLSARNVESQRRSKWRGIEGAVASFEAVARGVGEQGAGHAADEIARQTRVAMAVGDIRVGGRRVMQPLVHAFEEAVKVVAEFSLSGLWQSMLDEAIGEFLRLDRQGLAADEIDRRLEDFLDSLSEKPLRDRARRAVGVVYNQGRHMSLMTAKAANVAAYAVRSELLDQNTCSECQMLDGSVVEIGSPQYEALMPPARCLGQERCRGFYVALARDITEAA